MRGSNTWGTARQRSAGSSGVLVMFEGRPTCCHCHLLPHMQDAAADDELLQAIQSIEEEQLLGEEAQ